MVPADASRRVHRRRRWTAWFRPTQGGACTVAGDGRRGAGRRKAARAPSPAMDGVVPADASRRVHRRHAPPRVSAPGTLSSGRTSRLPSNTGTRAKADVMAEARSEVWARLAGRIWGTPQRRTQSSCLLGCRRDRPSQGGSARAGASSLRHSRFAVSDRRSSDSRTTSGSRRGRGGPTSFRRRRGRGRRDDGSTRRRDDETTRQRDDATTRRRDDATARRRGRGGRRDDGTRQNEKAR